MQLSGDDDAPVALSILEASGAPPSWQKQPSHRLTLGQRDLEQQLYAERLMKKP